MKRILLLGGNGYIGSRICEHLSLLGHAITNVDLCWFGKIFEDTVVKDYASLSEEFIRDHSHVIVLAAHSSVSMCAGTLHSCFNNNVVKFIDLIEKVSNDQVLIYASTAAVYGNNSSLVDESYPLASAISYYDYTKICNDNISQLYPHKNIIGLRLGSVGGYSKNFRRENLMNSLPMSAVKDNKISVTNAENYRSVLGMTDLCNALSAIIDNKEIKNRVYNLTSVNAKIVEFAKRISEISNCDLAVRDTHTTNYSFNCSNKLFESDYNFKFSDTIDSIFYDVVNNIDNIVSDLKREPR